MTGGNGLQPRRAQERASQKAGSKAKETLSIQSFHSTFLEAAPILSLALSNCCSYPQSHPLPELLLDRYQAPPGDCACAPAAAAPSPPAREVHA